MWEKAQALNLHPINPLKVTSPEDPEFIAKQTKCQIYIALQTALTKVGGLSSLGLPPDFYSDRTSVMLTETLDVWRRIDKILVFLTKMALARVSHDQQQMLTAQVRAIRSFKDALMSAFPPEVQAALILH